MRVSWNWLQLVCCAYLQLCPGYFGQTQRLQIGLSGRFQNGGSILEGFCYMLCWMTPGPGVWVGLGWVGSGFRVQMDLASASRLLRRLIFHIQVLVTGGGHIARHNGEASGGQEDNEYRGDGIHSDVI